MLADVKYNFFKFVKSCALALFLIIAEVAFSQPANSPLPAPAIKMIGSRQLSVKQLDNLALGQKFLVEFDGREILSTDSNNEQFDFAEFPVPKVIFSSSAPNIADEAIVGFQQFSWGNECNGGPIWFLAIRSTGQPIKSPAIDYCGGEARFTITEKEGKAIVLLPCSKTQDRAPQNRRSYEKWEFSSQRLKRLAKCPRSSPS